MRLLSSFGNAIISRILRFVNRFVKKVVSNTSSASFLGTFPSRGRLIKKLSPDCSEESFLFICANFT